MNCSRISLYAHSARNRVGRSFGASWAYTSAQIATCFGMWQVYAARYDFDTCVSLVSDCNRENSFLNLGGDHVNGEATAWGIAQWHSARRALILKNTGIDVWRDPFARQCLALIAEISQPWVGNPYHKVEASLLLAQGRHAKNVVLISQYERSGNQPRDIATQDSMSDYWAKYASDNGWKAKEAA